MTARYSNPSQGIGVNRFRVWPTKTTDSYNTVELAANFDLTDAMFGVPSAGTAWPSVLGVDGGVYREVRLLQIDRKPIGEVFAWWRPSGAIAIPAGCVECIGQTLTAAFHDFAGGGSITLPDLRNAFILGADSTLAALTPAAAVGAGNIDTTGGAPGLGYVGGSNQNILAISHLPSHDHGGGAHNHSITDPGHGHPVVDGGHSHGSIPRFDGQDAQLFGFGSSYHFASTQSPTNSAAATTGISIQTASTNISIANSGTTITTQGGGQPHDNRPRFVGLIFLMKVKYATTP